MDGSASACEFCDLDGFRANATLLYENERCLFANADHGDDGAPAGSGVIVPKAHRATVFDLTPEEITATFELLAEVRPALDERYRPDGYLIGWNSFEAAGQVVPHAHLHVLLRYAD